MQAAVRGDLSIISDDIESSDDGDDSSSQYTTTTGTTGGLGSEDTSESSSRGRMDTSGSSHGPYSAHTRGRQRDDSSDDGEIEFG